MTLAVCAIARAAAAPQTSTIQWLPLVRVVDDAPLVWAPDSMNILCSETFVPGHFLPENVLKHDDYSRYARGSFIEVYLERYYDQIRVVHSVRVEPDWTAGQREREYAQRYQVLYSPGGKYLLMQEPAMIWPQEVPGSILLIKRTSQPDFPTFSDISEPRRLSAAAHYLLSWTHPDFALVRTGISFALWNPTTKKKRTIFSYRLRDDEDLVNGWVTPDGRYLVFELTRHPDTGGYVHSVWSARIGAKQKRPKRLTAMDTSVIGYFPKPNRFVLQLNPDRNDLDHLTLATVKPDGSDRKEYKLAVPDWKRLAYVKVLDVSSDLRFLLIQDNLGAPEIPRRLWLMTLDGEERWLLRQDYHIANAKFSPDGKKIACIAQKTQDSPTLLEWAPLPAEITSHRPAPVRNRSQK